jgi:hypothetical protein
MRFFLVIAFCVFQLGFLSPVFSGSITPIGRITYCSTLWKTVSGLNGDIEVVNAEVQSIDFIEPGLTFEVVVTVKNNSTSCWADSGWDVFLESGNDTIGDFGATPAIQPGGTRTIAVLGTVPGGQPDGQLSFSARADPDSFLDPDLSNNTSDQLEVTVESRPHLKANAIAEEAVDISMGIYRELVTFFNTGSRDTCEGTYFMYIVEVPKVFPPDPPDLNDTAFGCGWFSPEVPPTGSHTTHEVLSGGTLCLDPNHYDYYLHFYQNPNSIPTGCIDPELEPDGFGWVHRYDHLIVTSINWPPACW